MVNHSRFYLNSGMQDLKEVICNIVEVDNTPVSPNNLRVLPIPSFSSSYAILEHTNAREPTEIH
jgi:hypothetical protein